MCRTGAPDPTAVPVTSRVFWSSSGGPGFTEVVNTVGPPESAMGGPSLISIASVPPSTRSGLISTTTSKLNVVTTLCGAGLTLRIPLEGGQPRRATVRRAARATGEGERGIESTGTSVGVVASRDRLR